MNILKFGGSSLQNQHMQITVINIIKDHWQLKTVKAVVCSAFGKSTNQLISMGIKASQKDPSYVQQLKNFCQFHLNCYEYLITKDRNASYLLTLFQELSEILRGVFLIGEFSLQTQDLVMSFGERMSNWIMTEGLRAQNVQAVFVDARNIITTNNFFGRAIIEEQLTYKQIAECGSQNPQKLLIVTGFIASTTNGVTTTLGRSGSDFTASLLARGLNAKEVEIWSDVNGVLTADPRKVPNAFTIHQLTYEEALELSHFGAEVIYPPSVHPVMEMSIPLRIKNTFNPNHPGTLINHRDKLCPAEDKTKQLIKGLTSLNKVALMTLSGSGMIGIAGVAMRLFKALYQANISVILISQASSEHSICLAIEHDKREIAKTLVESEFEFEISTYQVDKVNLEEEVSIIAVVGEQMRQTPGIAGRLFSALGQSKINVIAVAQGSSEINISFAVSKQDETRALKALHNNFFSYEEFIPICIIGATGNVGLEALKKIHYINEQQRKKQQRSIKVLGLINTKGHWINTKLINLTIKEKKQIDQLLEDSSNNKRDESFIESIVNLNKQNRANIIPYFIDCSASDFYLKLTEKILSGEAALASANKIPFAHQLPVYQKLTAPNSKTYYGTTVGAGLPIIHHLKRSKNLQDKIHKVEAILSGTLNYLLSNYDTTVPFSKLVKRAYNQKLTEPHPYLDLSGQDVARKLLIIAREMGEQIELQDLNCIPLLPNKLQQNFEPQKNNIDELFNQLLHYEDYYAKLYQEAYQNKKVLRYTALYDRLNKTLEVSLKSFDGQHPFFNVTGTDNIAIISSDLYPNGWIVQGPGAGPEVTAANLLAEILENDS